MFMYSYRYVYGLLLLCMFCSVYSVPLCFFIVYCLCVNVTETLLPPGIYTCVCVCVCVCVRGLHKQRMDKIQGFATFNVDTNVFTTGLDKFNKPGPSPIRRWKSTLQCEIVTFVLTNFSRN
jgi:hypothetical protein